MYYFTLGFLTTYLLFHPCINSDLSSLQNLQIKQIISKLYSLYSITLYTPHLPIRNALKSDRPAEWLNEPS